jgi:hypothetical protein
LVIDLRNFARNAGKKAPQAVIAKGDHFAPRPDRLTVYGLRDV